MSDDNREVPKQDTSNGDKGPDTKDGEEPHYDPPRRTEEELDEYFLSGAYLFG